jgi:hypothetical protein
LLERACGCQPADRGGVDGIGPRHIGHRLARGIRRRFNLIPFTVTIPPEERDPNLGEKLKAEWPAILQWMIDGCLDWQKQGLAPPQAVTAATDAYMEAQDAIGALTTNWPKPRAKAIRKPKRR